VLHRGQAVRADSFGFGQLLTGGKEPLVRLLDGEERYLPADALSVIPNELLEDEVLNRSMWHFYLTLRAYGAATLRRSRPPWVRGQDGIWMSPNSLREKPTPCPGSNERSVSAGVDDEKRVVFIDEAPDQPDVIECTASPLPGANSLLTEPGVAPADRHPLGTATR